MKRTVSIFLSLFLLATQCAWAQTRQSDAQDDAAQNSAVRDEKAPAAAVNAASMVGLAGVALGPVGVIGAFVATGAVLANNTGSSSTNTTSTRPAK